MERQKIQRVDCFENESANYAKDNFLVICFQSGEIFRELRLRRARADSANPLETFHVVLFMIQAIAKRMPSAAAIVQFRCER